MLRALAPALAGLVLLALAPATTGPITVSAAASLTDALDQAAAAYAAADGGSVRFNFAASNVLARQIASGAPVDLFISADEAQMDHAQQAGAIDESTRINLLGNRLAVVTALGSSPRIPADLALPSVRRIAVGDPAAVPAGVYARQYLERIGLWEGLQSKLVPVGNVRAAMSAVENGSVDAAIVYETDAAISRRVSVAFTVTGPDAPRIVYPAAVVRRTARRAEAERFLAFLRSAPATAIFRRLKFEPLAAVTR
jgi:molybdate transport system substrate-binding protein